MFGRDVVDVETCVTSSLPVGIEIGHLGKFGPGRVMTEHTVLTGHTILKKTDASHKPSFSRKLSLERSVGVGRVVKQSKGSPIPVKKLKNFFEDSPPTMGCVGLGHQPKHPNLNILMPTNTRQDSTICASQWEGAMQTRPRGGGNAALRTSCDWVQPSGPGCDGPTREIRLNAKNQESKK